MTTTKKTIALAELVEKGAEADLLREMIQPCEIPFLVDIETDRRHGT